MVDYIVHTIDSHSNPWPRHFTHLPMYECVMSLLLMTGVETKVAYHYQCGTVEWMNNRRFTVICRREKYCIKGTVIIVVIV